MPGPLGLKIILYRPGLSSSITTSAGNLIGPYVTWASILPPGGALVRSAGKQDGKSPAKLRSYSGDFGYRDKP